ncbi:hypothetical protein Taro_018481 [Colocasia esculenta]|uniref:Uncharacterized protein n=1 Tax=Colocasia esculenta TaxID=4460 RepID=A0A843UZ65_COLES|nr:hypothetical protein [Colocasia esculenta]
MVPPLRLYKPTCASSTPSPFLLSLRHLQRLQLSGTRGHRGLFSSLPIRPDPLAVPFSAFASYVAVRPPNKMEAYRQSQMPRFDCLLFDLDDTLYPLSSGIATACRKNIGDYMVEKLGISEDKVPDLCNLLYKNYGTTMSGLRAIGYNFDYDEYHRFYSFRSLFCFHLNSSFQSSLFLFLVFYSFVHGRLPYDNLKPDPVLRNLLLSLPIGKVIFTNADKVHAAEVLSRLGLEGCFEGIICFETLNPGADASEGHTSDSIFDIVGHFARPDAGTELPKTPVLCKPSEDAMERALRIAGINPQRTIFFDDSARNVLAGKRIGLHTVLVGTSHRIKGADHALESIHNLREALPELWEGAEKEDVRYSGKVAIETSVTA